MSRRAGAIEAIRECIATVSDLPQCSIGDDDDFVDDLHLDGIERESLQLVIEEIFAIDVPDELWNGPLYRTPSSLAEWCIRKSEEAAWAETQRQRKLA